MEGSFDVNDSQLNEVLQAAAERVVQNYTAFHVLYPKRAMMEVGLTDQFMMGAQAFADAYHLDVGLDWYTAENVTGCDFGVSVNQHQPNHVGKDLFFQAKVAKRDKENNLYADFLFESTKKIGNNTITKNYQNILLADWALKNNGFAYYVIYDHTAVYWVNAIHLKTFFDTHPVQDKKFAVEWCVMAMKKLAKKTFHEATNLVYEA